MRRMHDRGAGDAQAVARPLPRLLILLLNAPTWQFDTLHLNLLRREGLGSTVEVKEGVFSASSLENWEQVVPIWQISGLAKFPVGGEEA